MQRAKLDESPNPFSIEQLSSRREPKAFLRRVKFFALVVLLFAGSSIISSQYSKFRVSRLCRGFASLSAGEKLERLDQLAQCVADSPSAAACGEQVMRTIVGALADENAEVATRAHDLLHRWQADWTVLEFDQAIGNQMQLVADIENQQADLSGQRRELAIDLLQQAAKISVRQDSDATRQLYFAATAAIETLSPRISDAARRSDSQPIDETARPLPVDHLARGVDWTEWPPRDNKVANSNPLDSEGVVAATARPAGPTIHQTSKSPLQAVPSDEVVVLREMTPNRTHTVDSGGTSEPFYDPPAKLQPVAHVIDGSWQQADMDTIIQSLALPNPEMQVQARNELGRRGFSDIEISIARQIATGDLAAKTALIQSLTQTNSVNARPWLVLLLDDPNREVRLRSISALAELKDPWVIQQLKLRMVDERDQTVAFRIRRVLNLR